MCVCHGALIILSGILPVFYQQPTQMFVGIIGTRFSGKSSIENYLVETKGFKSVRLIQSNSDHDVGHFEEKFEVGAQQSEIFRIHSR